MADNEIFDLDSFDFGEFDSLDTGVNVKRQPVQTPDVSNIVTSLKKRAMIVIFVIDISGSMKGARIGAVNDAIRNVLPELKKREKGNTSAEIKVAILEFSTNAHWRTLIPEPVSTFQFTDRVHDRRQALRYGSLPRNPRRIKAEQVVQVFHQSGNRHRRRRSQCRLQEGAYGIH